jgi:phosphonate transport system substrate-binding protein
MGEIRHSTFLLILVVTILILITACKSGNDSQGSVFYIGGIPDQDASVLQSRFNVLADYLSEETGVKVKYLPSIDYAAVVTSFRQGDLHLAWFGGLTGVQARLAAPESRAIVQRPQDEAFHSVFIAQKGLDITSLENLRGKRFTFGSESSTSGHLMPRSFLKRAGIDAEKELATVSYSGSHDKTWKLVEAGSFESGALNAAVWQSRVEAGDVDLSKVELFWTTPPYYDYHWVLRGDVDKRFGDGIGMKIEQALLALNNSNAGKHKEIMDAFLAKQFIPTNNKNYQDIEDVARGLGIIE